MKNIEPWCCGVKMQAITRYESNGVVYRTFICNNRACGRKEDVEWND